ncbi:chitin deacetylase [Anopheles sinensis]|uniref:Chitin deacetylase n=1 Tax=Anopheles sinensis TaxID=74873 RepID=A0A084VCE5_ANOSI|nr:chitin deacetylase [Anopheles sinensis]
MRNRDSTEAKGERETTQDRAKLTNGEESDAQQQEVEIDNRSRQQRLGFDSPASFQAGLAIAVGTVFHEQL